MSIISILDLLAGLMSGAACVILWRSRKRWSRSEKTIVVLLCLLATLINEYNFWDWLRHPLSADLYESWGDYLQILQPALWGMLFYIVVQVSQRRELERSRKQMRDLVEHMPVIVQAFDEQGKVLAWNGHAERVTGFSKQEVIGESAVIKKIFPDTQYREQILAECHNKGGQYQHKVWPIRCKQRFERQVSWSNIALQFPIAGWANWCVGIDVTEQVMAQRHLEHMATHDELTGLANRALLRDRLAHALSLAQRKQARGALLLIDLDFFKMINDTHGHPVGDQLLRELGERLLQCVKATDTVARLGGDEFLILLEQVSIPEEVSMVAERITNQVSERPFHLFGNEISVRFSMGITVFPDDDVRVDELMKNVDLALYAAKENGRNNYHFYSRTLHKKLRWQHQISEKLRASIDAEAFFIEYQPQVDRVSHEVVGLEALIRWNASGEVPLSPSAFIPIAEQMGLMPSLGRWVIQRVCQQISQWNAQGTSPVVSVNLSAIQLYQSNLLDSVSDIVQQYGVDCSKIEFEITETAVMRNIDAAVATMNKLAKLGFKISLDDFGKGYSSLSYLKKFPISKIKIDQSFVRSLEVDPVDAAIVRSVIDLGHSLKIKVLAEGVETLGQVQRLEQNGCDYYQGFYFSHPLSAGSAAAVLHDQLH